MGRGRSLIIRIAGDRGPYFSLSFRIPASRGGNVLRSWPQILHPISAKGLLSLSSTPAARTIGDFPQNSNKSCPSVTAKRIFAPSSPRSSPDVSHPRAQPNPTPFYRDGVDVLPDFGFQIEFTFSLSSETKSEVGVTFRRRYDGALVGRSRFWVAKVLDTLVGS